MEDKNDWRQTPEGAEYLALVADAALANGWCRKSVASTARYSHSLKQFKERAQKYFAPEAPKEKTWRDTEEGKEYIAFITSAALKNGWSQGSVAGTARRSQSLVQLKEWSQRYFAPKPPEPPKIPKEKDWRDSEEGASYLAFAYESALDNGWTRQSVGNTAAHASSFENFKEKAQRFFAPKPPEQPRKEDWRDSADGSEYLAMVVDAAVSNGWSRGSVGSTAGHVSSFENFKEKAQRFFAPKPAEIHKEKDWRDSEEGSEYLAMTYDAAVSNGWSRGSVGSTAREASSLENFKEGAQRYFAPQPGKTPAEKWGKWIREQQIAAGIPITRYGTNWCQRWKTSVRECPDKHPNLEQSARAYVAGKLKDLEYWRAVEWAKTEFEGKVRLLLEWLVEDEYNKFPLKKKSLLNRDGKIDPTLLRAGVTKVSKTRKWRNLQYLFPPSFWSEFYRAVQEAEDAEKETRIAS